MKAGRNADVLKARLHVPKFIFGKYPDIPTSRENFVLVATATACLAVCVSLLSKRQRWSRALLFL